MKLRDFQCKYDMTQQTNEFINALATPYPDLVRLFITPTENSQLQLVTFGLQYALIHRTIIALEDH